ncbi:MAG: YccF domain-containing protein [Deltaproteobacteria bacterium]|nr:YccF domain-containing protein [Deltaproteobacteria bacterium]
MRLLGNILWIIFGGLLTAIGWALAGLLVCATVVGIPFGMQCFKIARLVLAPFGKDIELGNFEAAGLVGNIIWIVLLGWELFLSHVGAGIVLCCTIIGIPFGLQHFKLALLALLPFGAKIVPAKG